MPLTIIFNYIIEVLIDGNIVSYTISLDKNMTYNNNFILSVQNLAYRVPVNASLTL